MHNTTPPRHPDAITQLDVSQAVLEDEENPSASRAMTPQERALLLPARSGWGAACRGALRSVTSSPVKLLGGAAVVGLALALAVAKRPGRA